MSKLDKLLLKHKDSDVGTKIKALKKYLRNNKKTTKRGNVEVTINPDLYASFILHNI